jgi:hypothetical protein
MDDTSKLISSFQALEQRFAGSVDDVHAMASTVLELGYHDLQSHGFDFDGATKRVCERYRELLAQRPNDARCLNNLAALLLSTGQPAEGRRYALLALAAVPNNANVHQNLAIADVYCFITPIHKLPSRAVEDGSFLIAYFDPHAH